MEDHNKTELIIFTKSSFKDWREKELTWWLITTGQYEIAKQEAKCKKFMLSNLRNTPAIYLS